MTGPGERDDEADAWDRQIEADVRAGKLDGLADAAVKAWKHRKARPIALDGDSISKLILDDRGE